MISRCRLNLPVRIKKDGSIDFVDSAFLCGMLSIFSSSINKSLLGLYIKDGKLVRHPVGDEQDRESTRPEATSRDQLVAHSSSKTDDSTVNQARLHYARKWFINKDILLPHIRLYLYRQAQAKVDWYNLWLYVFAYPLMILDVIYMCTIPRFQKVEDQHEINQMLCLVNGYGRVWTKAFLMLHPTPDENLKDYYCRWRDQAEIYDMYLAWKRSL